MTEKEINNLRNQNIMLQFLLDEALEVQKATDNKSNKIIISEASINPYLTVQVKFPWMSDQYEQYATGYIEYGRLAHDEHNRTYRYLIKFYENENLYNGPISHSNLKSIPILLEERIKELRSIK